MFKKNFLCILLCVAAFAVQAQVLKVVDLKTNYKTDPIGIYVSLIRFGWKLNVEKNDAVQKSYEIRISTDQSSVLKGSGLIWSSGKIESDQSVNVTYRGPALKAKTRYFWQVRVTDNYKNTTWSNVSFFETAMLTAADWQANWIELATATNGKVMPAPVFAKQFELTKAVKSARLYVTSHGLYEAEINGKKVGNEFLTPGWTSYHKRLQYQTYDVSTMLKSGANLTAVTIGDGWYRGNLEFNNKRNLYGKEVALLYQLEIKYTDGSNSIIVSDRSWKSSIEGPVKKSDIYNGETYDARLYQPMPNV
ncbi:MAG: alpha-L-rhamnosidase, partial [Chryseobacterium sp.]